MDWTEGGAGVVVGGGLQDQSADYFTLKTVEVNKMFNKLFNGTFRVKNETKATKTNFCTCGWGQTHTNGFLGEQIFAALLFLNMMVGFKLHSGPLSSTETCWSLIETRWAEAGEPGLRTTGPQLDAKAGRRKQKELSCLTDRLFAPQKLKLRTGNKGEAHRVQRPGLRAQLNQGSEWGGWFRWDVGLTPAFCHTSSSTSKI